MLGGRLERGKTGPAVVDSRGVTSVLHWLQDLFLRTSPWVGALSVLLSLWIGLYLGLRATRFAVGRRTARSRRLGRQGEARAWQLLERVGFRVVEREAVAEGRIRVDGTTVTFRVRVDALVERGGRLFVAELKGGPEASKITNRGTRRQLLEYAFVFDVEGVLLVDAYTGRIHTVQFGSNA